MHRLEGPAPTEQESVGSLVSRLGNDVRRIVRAELGLFQARAQAALGVFRAAGVLIGLGIALALGGLGALVAAAVLAVAIVLPAWAAALIVGGGMLLMAVLLLAIQARMVSAGVREAMSEVRVEIRDRPREEAYGGE